MKTSSARLTIAGFLFAVIWSTAGVATKIGLQSVQPFVLAIPRFFISAGIMLFISHIILKKRLPKRTEWKRLALYSLLNISIFLGLYVIAMQHVSAGLSSLSVASNPVMISIITALWLKQPLKKSTVAALLLCIAGIVIAAYPLLKESYATPTGLIILFVCMLSYSAGALYFSRSQWNDLDMLTINGWQTLIGGSFLVPLLFIFYDSTKNSFDARWIGCALWLAIPISIIAVQLWLYLLKDDVVKASFWLFLCPVSGFIIAAIIIKEPLNFYTLTGVVIVLAGLYIEQSAKADRNKL